MDKKEDFPQVPHRDDSSTDKSGDGGWTEEDLAARFGRWAAEVLKDEAPPRGLAADIIGQVLPSSSTDGDTDPMDAYGLWSAITALTQEIKLQGRAFKQLHDALAAQADPVRTTEIPAGLSDLLKQIADHLQANKAGREREIRMEADRKARKELLEVLIDTRDRLIRGHANDAEPDTPQPSWLDRLSGRAGHLERLSESQRARQDGYRLSLERLEEALVQHGVREISCEDEMFDPRTMNAIDLEETDARPDGQVMEVYQRGYEWNGQVIRTAQIRVARRPPGGAEGTIAPRKDTNQSNQS